MPYFPFYPFGKYIDANEDLPDELCVLRHFLSGYIADADGSFKDWAEEFGSDYNQEVLQKVIEDIDTVWQKRGRLLNAVAGCTERFFRSEDEVIIWLSRLRDALVKEAPNAQGNGDLSLIADD